MVRTTKQLLLMVRTTKQLLLMVVTTVIDEPRSY
jgi:hypothetical protein